MSAGVRNAGFEPDHAHDAHDAHDVETGTRGKDSVSGRLTSYLKKHKKSREKEGSHRPSCWEYSKFISLFYAVFVIILGLIFPLAEALSQVWLESAASAVLIAYVTGVGTVFLLYLQFYLLRGEEKHHAAAAHGDAPHNGGAPRHSSATLHDLPDTTALNLMDWDVRRKLEAIYEIKYNHEHSLHASLTYSSLGAAEGRGRVEGGHIPRVLTDSHISRTLTEGGGERGRRRSGDQRRSISIYQSRLSDTPPNSSSTQPDTTTETTSEHSTACFSRPPTLQPDEPSEPAGADPHERVSADVHAEPLAETSTCESPHTADESSRYDTAPMINTYKRTSSHQLETLQESVMITNFDITGHAALANQAKDNEVNEENQVTEEKRKQTKSRVISVTPVVLERADEGFNKNRRFGFSGAADTEPCDNIEADDDDDDFDDDDDARSVGLASGLTIDDRREWVDVSRFGSLFSHEGSSFYLRIGALVFGLGHVVYCAVELREVFESREHCMEKFTHGWSFIPRIIFVIVQTFFLFKGSKVHITRQKSLVWFGMMHLTATNMCLWLRTLISEIKVEFSHSMANHGPADNSTGGTLSHANVLLGLHASDLLQADLLPVEEEVVDFNNSNDPDTCNKLVNFVSRYLFPLVLEYSIIAIGTFITITHCEIDKGTEYNLTRGFKNLIKVSALKFLHSNDGEKEASHAEEHHSMLTKSHSGFFVGVLMIAISLVSIVMFHVYDQDQISLYIFKSSDVVLHATIIIACSAGFYMTSTLAHVSKPMSVDDVLLLIAMVGSVTLEVSIIVAAIDAVTSPVHNTTAEDVLHLVASILGATQTVMQTMFILFALRLYPASKRHVTEMPGRGCVAFLLVANVAIWLLRTFLGKAAGMTFASKYYGDVAWLLIMNIDYPLLLFYRFHSSVCFADIWKVAYSPIHRKIPQLPQLPAPPAAALPQGAERRRYSGDGGTTSTVQFNQDL